MTSLIKKFFSLTFPVKFLIGTIFGIIAGPGLLAFLSEYATYLYAIKINIRPPLEGIPYLSASIALASLILSIVSIFIFLISQFLLTILINYPVKWVFILFIEFGFKIKTPKILAEKIHDKLIIQLQSLKSIDALKAIFILTILISFSFLGILKLCLTILGANNPHFLALLSFIIYIFIVLLSLWKPVINWAIVISSAIIFYAFSFSFLFNTNDYAQYLKKIKYGGEIGITIEYKDTRKKEDAFLLLRTIDYIFIKKNNEDTPVEVPLDNVRSITYQ